MPYCSHCGNKIDVNAKFCSCCGKAIDESGQSRTTRTQTFQGDIKKCPACGAEAPSMTAFCPECGHEFNSRQVSSTIQRFTEKLHEYDVEIAKSRQEEGGWYTWNTAGKIGWVILNIYLVCIPLLIYSHKRKGSANSAKSKVQQKVSFIENYVFPNEREAILEALLFIKAQVSSFENSAANGADAFWEKIWVNKAAQLYQKAEVVMYNDPVAERAYSDIIAMDQLFRKRQLIKRLIIVGVVAAVIVLSLLFGDSSASTMG